jgi:hypothetical protein
MGERLKLAYADPPYLGCCKIYGHRHQKPYGCWDDPTTHMRVLEDLTEFDGFAYSMTSQSLGAILPLAEKLRMDYRIAAWVKPFAAYKANVRIAYTWEPVLFWPGRDSSTDGAPVGRDHLGEPITLQKGLTGAKPERFCRWVLDLMGYVPGDDVTDIFPGTGVLERVLDQGTFVFAAALSNEGGE